jgi:hypothetical protein
MSIDSSGQIGSVYDVDNATLQITSNTLSVKTIQLANMAANSVDSSQLVSSSVTTTKIADANVTKAKLAALGQQVSSSCGSFSSTSGTKTDVTNLTVTITTTGRPVMLVMQSDGTGGGNILYNTQGLAGGFLGNLYFIRGSTTIATSTVSNSIVSVSQAIRIPPASFNFIDVVGAGTYTYKVQVDVASGAIGVNNSVLVAYEM